MSAGRGHTDGERHLCLAVGRHLHGVESGRDDLHGIGQRRDLHLYRVRVAVADGWLCRFISRLSS